MSVDKRYIFDRIVDGIEEQNGRLQADVVRLEAEVGRLRGRAEQAEQARAAWSDETLTMVRQRNALAYRLAAVTGKYAGALIDEVVAGLAAATDKSGDLGVDVGAYSQPERIFNYCPYPETCRSGGDCQHRGGKDHDDSHDGPGPDPSPVLEAARQLRDLLNGEPPYELLSPTSVIQFARSMVEDLVDLIAEEEAEDDLGEAYDDAYRDYNAAVREATTVNRGGVKWGDVLRAWDREEEFDAGGGSIPRCLGGVHHAGGERDR